MQDIVGDEISDNFPFGDFSSAEYWDCNSSVAELALRNLGEYDWYLDNSRPFVPWWIYNFQHEYAAIAYELPIPKRCWRRFPRHTTGRPKNPETGEEYLLWPGQLGYPPGYWTDRDPIYKRLKKRFMINQSDWDRITTQANKDNHYRVMEQSDIRALYDQAVAEQEAVHGEGYVEDLLSTHDPVGYDSTGQPMWEIHHDLINHARYVLSQLRYVYKVFSAGINQYYGSARKLSDSGPPSDLDRDTSVEAYTAARDRAMQPSNLEWVSSNGYSADIALHGDVNWRPVPSKWTGALVSIDTRIGYGLVTITLFQEASEGAGKELPIYPNKGTMLFHLKYQTGYECTTTLPPAETGKYKLEHLEVGVAGKSFLPVCANYGGLYWEYAFVGSISDWEGWVYDTGSKKWSYIMYYWIVPAEPWMADGYFANADPAWTWCMWRKSTLVQMVSGSAFQLPGMLEIDFESFDTSVFEEDDTNFIEV